MECSPSVDVRKSAELIMGRPPAKMLLTPNADKKRARDPPTASVGPKSAGRKLPGARVSKINKPTTLAKKDLERIKNASDYITMDDRIDAQIKHEEAIRRIEEDAVNQKLMFKKIDEEKLRAREEKEKESLFAEDRVKILEQSFIARHEQEEEVKRVNQIMLNAKCHAVRDAQLQEKVELAKGLKAYDDRLEKIMSDTVKAALAKEDENVKRELLKKQKYAAEIKHQLMERENERFLEAELIEEEAKVMAQANEAIKRDEERRIRLTRERREQLRQELSKIVEMSNLFKKSLFEQERVAEMRIRAYMKDKEQRERTLAIERKLEKQAFERKQKLLFDLQSKILESKSQREEMALTRQQENIEREYRRKEMEAALRKKELEKSLAEARMSQLHDAQLREALQIAHNEDDFQKIVENLKKEEAKQAKLQEERLKNRNRYRDDIIRQMNDKEMARRHLHERDQAEAFEWREQEKERQRNVKSVIQAKLATMREANLPEKYIKDVEMQLRKISEQK